MIDFKSIPYINFLNFVNTSHLEHFLLKIENKTFIDQGFLERKIRLKFHFWLKIENSMITKPHLFKDIYP